MDKVLFIILSIFVNSCIQGIWGETEIVKKVTSEENIKSYNNTLKTGYLWPQDSNITNEILNIVNKIRKENKVKDVKLSNCLNKVAENHAYDMYKNNYFEHKSLSGKRVGERLSDANYPENKSVAENIALGYVDANTLVSDWNSSENHRLNMISEKFEEMGVAYAPAPLNKNGFVFVQIFGSGQTTNWTTEISDKGFFICK